MAPEIAVPEAIPVPDIRSPAVAAERQETPGAADLLPPITVTEASAPRPEVPAGSDMSAPIQPPAQPTTTPPVIREGLVMPIPGADTAVVTHTLNLRVGYTCYPLYYLHSNRIDLREWEMHEVRVYGKEVWHPGWNRAVIEVTSIQIHRPD